jgi:4-amino-4-deoxy-L-arabinose transferase-like glycosyltransferase
MLATILVLAALMRLVGSAPPGVHVDEASNAWNAWCLLNLGTDEHFQTLPTFYTGSFGDNRSALYLYFLMPFQAVFGFSAYTTRLPAVFGGIASVGLMYVVGKRLFDARVGLAAAFLMALTPWQVFSSRWGHESSIAPLLVLSSVAALLWAGAPFTGQARPMTPMRGFVAGAICGLACYGYAAVRIALPVLLIAITLATLKHWIDALRDPTRRWGVAAMALGVLVTFAPLVHRHLTDDGINTRGNLTWVWDASDPTTTRIAKVVDRYPAHFGPTYLFLDRNDDPTQSMPPGFGVLHWYALPFLLVGVVVLARRTWSSPAARVAVVALLAYPAGDLLSSHAGPNTLRSLAGLPWMELTTGVGLVACYVLLRERWRWPAIATMGVVGIAFGGLFLWQLDRDFRTDPARWSVRTMDIAAAVDWLQPRLRDCDAVFWTQKDTSFVYAPMLVYLQASPRMWLDEPVARSRSVGERFQAADLVWQVGKHHFMFTHEFVGPAVAGLGRGPRVAYIVRPGELDLDKDVKPSAEILGPDGKVSLQLFDLQY